jgi:hypothetical protein
MSRYSTHPWLHRISSKSTLDQTDNHGGSLIRSDTSLDEALDDSCGRKRVFLQLDLLINQNGVGLDKNFARLDKYQNR